MSVVDQVQGSAVRARRSDRILALDGLRGVAVLAVMLFHTGSQPLSGGFLGVDVFFVLSGFLIGGILLDELRTSGRVGLSQFWLRRARRLAPALLLLLLTVGLARLAVLHPNSDTWRAEMLASLTYTMNWFQVVSGGDYFSQFGVAQPLLHTWSLAIEEQFYLLFAVLMAVILKRARARVILLVYIVIILASAGWMAALSDADQVWAYYATTTRVQALVVGAALALIVRSDRSWTRAVGPRLTRVISLLGATVIVIAFIAPPARAVLFHGGFLLVGLASAGVIWGVLGGGWLAAALSWRPLVLLGTVSYGVYLWHWPVFLWLGTTQPSSGVVKQAWAFVITLLLAAVSYRLVETPVRWGRFTRLPVVRQWGTYAVAAGVVVLLALLPARTVPADERIAWPESSQVPGRIMVAGDSVMMHLWQYFPRDEYPEALVDGPLTVGCGIVDFAYLRDGRAEAPEKCRGWRDEWRRKRDEIRPDVAVIGSTVWDGFDRYIEGRSLAPGTPEFDDAYLAAFRDAIAVAGADGQIPVYVAGQPCLSSRVDTVLNDPGRALALDSLTRAATDSMPNAHYVDTRALTCTDEGTASDSFLKRPLREDGVHWSQHGANLFWQTSLTQIIDDRTSGRVR